MAKKKRKLKEIQKKPNMPEVVINQEQAQAISDAILQEVADQVMAEYNSLNKYQQRLLEKNSDVLKEILVGLREGVNGALAEITAVDGSSQTQAVVAALEQTAAEPAQPTSVPALEKEAEKLLDKQEKKQASKEKPQSKKQLIAEEPGFFRYFLGGLMGKDVSDVKEAFSTSNVTPASVIETTSNVTPASGIETTSTKSFQTEEDKVEADRERDQTQAILAKQASTLVEIRDILAAMSPAQDSILAQSQGEGSFGIPNIDIDLPFPRGGKGSPKAPTAKGKGFMGRMGGIVKSAGSVLGKVGSVAGSILTNPTALKIGGSVAAAGIGAYNAYTGFQEADESYQEKISQIEAAVADGTMTTEQAIYAKEQLSKADDEAKGSAIGSGAGSAIGGVAGAVLGTALGPLGTVAGGYLGSQAGGWLGEKVGGLAGTIKGAFISSPTTPLAATPVASTPLSNLVPVPGESPVFFSSAMAPSIGSDTFTGKASANTMASLESKTRLLEQSKKEEKQAPIIVQAPPPTVINNSAPTKVMPQPFAGGIRNGESSVSSFMSSRYAF